MRARKTALFLFAGLALLACRPNAPENAGDEPSHGAGLAELALLYAAENLSGEPNLFELQLSYPGGEADLTRRSGDLPAPGQVIRATRLPAGKGVRVTMRLFKDLLKDTHKTHLCSSDETVNLTPGKTASTELICYPVAGEDPVKVFLKVAGLKISLETKDPSDLLEARDWSAPALFAHYDDRSRRVSLRSNATGITFHVGGEVSYFAPSDEGSLLERLICGETLTLSAVGGRSLAANGQPAELRLAGAPLLFDDAGVLKAALPVELLSLDRTVEVKGNLVEETYGHEFTVVSYNVENFFDQTDEDRNSGYGDYRITPNADGFSSNYGEPVEFNGRMMSFTEVKAAGIRQTLLGIDPAGPEIVGLQEVESKAALETLFEAVKDLGYIEAQFTEWGPGDTPTAIGVGLLSKFPITAWSLVHVGLPPTAPDDEESPRKILRVDLDVHGHPLVVYVNHWKSKGGPESRRKEYAATLEADVQALLATNPNADYIILGDLNSEYNETLIIEDRHNDTDGTTGINHVLKAQGDELAVVRGEPGLKYNLHYELDRSARRTAWHAGYDWSGLDHMIIGKGMYDSQGITYVDNSFTATHAGLPRLTFLFNEDGTTRRWIQERLGKHTVHKVGGYSDHAPLFARFQIRRVQSQGTIWLDEPSRPDRGDPDVRAP